jgi:predicted small secreted protein
VVNGAIEAVVTDGSGGWYIGGTFTQIGDTVRNNIAHINSDGTLDAFWDPDSNSPVSTLAVSGNTVYAGGNFTYIGGQSRQFIAALDASTGNATSWNPNANVQVLALAVSGNTVYAGGNFTSIGGQSRYFIAALDASTGNATSWNPNANGQVSALAVSGNTVYAGGNFTSIGGQSRTYIAALDASTGNATSWSPSANSLVFALAVSGNTVYAGGNFTSIGGQSRNNIAALDASTGNATSWNPNANSNGTFTPPYVYALAVSGNTVYAGGSFTSIGGQSLNNIAALDASTGNATSWNPNANGQVLALAVSGNTVYAGGNFISLGGQSRNNIAALDASTGIPTSWNPNANGNATFTPPYVYALAVSGNTVYAGGSFTSIGGQSRNNIAALDASTGNATSWDPNANNIVSALAVSGNTVYVGGGFTSIGGQSQNYLAALDASTGIPTPSWNPGASGQVNAIAVSGNTLYVGGSFGIAALDASTGIGIPWNPDNLINPINSDAAWVSALAVSGNTIYVGGDFDAAGYRIGGQARVQIAALDASTGNATSWYPSLVGAVTSLAASGNTVYAGGYFFFVGLQIRDYIAALDASTGNATSWHPNADSPVGAIALSGNTIYVGGSFSSIGGEARAGFAMFGITYSISGTVSDSGGSPLGGVSMALTGTSSATTQTAFDGTYTFTGLLSGAYSITPTENLYTFSPATINVTITDSDLVSQDFTGQTGSLTVTISPAAAVSAGAMWSVDGGTLQASGTTISGLTVGQHTVAFNNITGWTAPASQTVTIANGQTASLTGTYIQQTGSLTVTISPTAAASAGAMWNVDSGTWQTSGATVSNLSVGWHTVGFNNVQGWTTPASQTANIANGQTTSLTGTYVQQTGSLTVTISPAAAVSAGAMWNVDSGTWQASGITVSGITVGQHTVAFNNITGWNPPASQTVTIANGQTTTLTGAYIQQTGSLTVTISPAAAASAGAMWNVDSGKWGASGTTISGLTIGQHTVAFNNITGWNAPANQTVTIANGQTTSLTGTYVQQTGSLSVTISPAAAVTAGAMWNVDGGTWQTSRATVSNLSVGSHTVGFNNLQGWTAPSGQTVNIANGQTTAASGTYVQLIDFLKVTIGPLAAVHAGAQWQVDGGVWQNSGVTVNGLTYGRHVVGFKEIQGWKEPVDETVTIAKGKTTTSIGAYLQLPVILNYKIANEAANTISRQVTLNNQTSGNPTKYMASESQDFNGAVWQAYSAAPKFTLSAGGGTKTVYFKVENSAGESGVASDTIHLIVPPTVTSFQINNGATATSSRTVTLDNTVTGSPTYYMASQSSAFIGAAWKPYAAAPAFTLSSGNGTKTVHFKVRNAAGASTVVSETITLAVPAALDGD